MDLLRRALILYEKSNRQYLHLLLCNHIKQSCRFFPPFSRYPNIFVHSCTITFFCLSFSYLRMKLVKVYCLPSGNILLTFLLDLSIHSFLSVFLSVFIVPYKDIFSSKHHWANLILVK